jgi:hypothetical protein
MKTTMSIILPWPASAVSPNARVHWSVKQAAVRVMKRRAKLEALALLGGRKVRATGYRILACVADRRKHDYDNIIASCKGYLDGIAAAFDQDDAEWEFNGMRLTRNNDKREMVIIMELAGESVFSSKDKE